MKASLANVLLALLIIAQCAWSWTRHGTRIALSRRTQFTMTTVGELPRGWWPRNNFWWNRPSGVMPTLSGIGIGIDRAFALSRCILPPTMQPSDFATPASLVGEFDQLQPLLCFVNRESGGKKGKMLLESLRSLELNGLQICDLKDEAPGARLRLFKMVSSNVNVLCCGGDGTMNWILDEISKLNMTVGSFGIIPMGTGNDLFLQTYNDQKEQQKRARLKNVTEYSYAVSAEQFCANPKTVLAHHAWNLQNRLASNQVPLDRWTANIRTTEVSQYIQQQKSTTPNTFINKFLNLKRFLKVLTLTFGAKRQTAKVFSNYIGFGVDGAVGLSFSHLRSAAPFLFFSGVLNKIWYAICGLYQIIFGAHRRDLSRVIHVTCDGKDVTIPHGIRGLVALNINSYAGGTKVWRADEPFQKGFGARMGVWNSSCMSDGILEVMGVFGIRHLGLIKSGMASAVPICQGRHITFNCTIQTPMQIDGEPFMQKPCIVELSHFQKVNVTVPLIVSSAN